MKRFIVITSLLFISILMMAQEVRISGKIVDRVTHDVLNGVSITVPRTNISTVTNADGVFVLKLATCPDVINISSLGYKRQAISLHKDRLNDLSISLTPTAFTLPDLNVWQSDPEKLVLSAIEHITDNFVQTREMHSTFYRETLQKGSRFIDVSEAILQVCNRGYDKGITMDRVKVEHGRHMVSQRTKDTLSVKVQGGPKTVVAFDVIKNTELLIGDIKDGCYQFGMEMPEELDGRLQIVISFQPRTVRDWPLYRGRIYLDRETLAFSRIELSLDVSDKQKVVNMLLVKKPMGLRFKPQELTTVVSYLDGRINYMRTLFKFKCDWKRRLFSRSYTCCSEMVVTDLQPDYDGPNIAPKECFSERDILINTIDNYDDPDFWKDYNIIEPTQTLEKAITKLKKY